MDSFLQHTARSIIKTIDWKQLSSTTLVLPSHRAGLILKDEILRLQQESHAQAIWAPRVQTLPQLQDALSPLYAEDEFFTIVRLYRHYCRLNADDNDLMPLDVFYGWGKQMLADFTNIDASMPASQVPNFFENTIAAHELEQWKLDPEVEERLRSLMGDDKVDVAHAKSIRRQYEHLWRQLFELYQALRKEMQAEQKGYAGMRQRSVIECWDDESVQTKIAGRTFVFVGFNYLLPVESELMTRLRDTQHALFYWDFVADFQTNEKAFSFAQRNSAILGSVLPPRRWTEPRQVTVTTCVSREAQAQYVHQWLKENYTARGQKVGVVICDETMLESVIYTLPAITLPGETEPVPINITKGFPLRNTHIYARVLNWLAQQQRDDADAPVTTDLIDRMLDALFPAKNNDSIEDSQEEPRGLKWQELLILESEYQVRKIANQMRLLISQSNNNVPFTLKLLRLLMRRTMESVTMPFHGEPVTDIQVMGVLETRLLDFDKLLLLNVEEGVLPQRQRDTSFIPFYLRKAYSMQTSDERATVYAYNFFRLLSRAGHTTLLYATAETAEGGRGQSRFIMQMLVSPEFNVQKMCLLEKSITSSSLIDDTTNAQSLLSKLHLGADGILYRADGSRYRLSPSALNTYISCPLSFYRQYILGYRPPEEEDGAVFASNTLGSFVHYAMEYIYRSYLKCNGEQPVRVSPDEIEEIRANDTKLQEALAYAYRKMKDYIPEKHIGENKFIIGYVKNILARDCEDAKIGLQIFKLEHDCTFSVQIPGSGEILTGGQIDRLDIFGPKGHEHLRVVDYKSGNYGDDTRAKKMSTTWEDLLENEDKGYIRQTLIYSHAVKQNDKTGLPIEPNLFFCRTNLTRLDTTVQVNNETVTDYQAIQGEFYNRLQTKVTQVLTTTDFPQCEESKCSSFCPFFDFCGRKPKDF